MGILWTAQAKVRRGILLNISLIVKNKANISKFCPDFAFGTSFFYHPEYYLST